MENFTIITEEVQKEKIVILTCLGTLLHWFDFYIMSLMFPIILKGNSSFDHQQLNFISAGLIFIGFFIRPISAIFLSPKIDTEGRKIHFTKSLNFIAFSSFIFLITPFHLLSFEFTFLILAILRVIQGVALSLEYGSALAYIYETIDQKKVGLFTSIVQLTAPFGFLLALIAMYCLKISIGETLSQTIYWRLPVAFGLVLVFLSIHIRKSLQENREFELLKARNELLRSPLKELFYNREYFEKLIYSLLVVSIPQGFIYYLAHFYMPNYFVSLKLLSGIKIEFLSMLILVFLWPLPIVSGLLADRFGAKRVFQIISGLSLFFFLGILIYLNTTPIFSLWGISIILILVFMISLLLYGISGVVLAQLFPVTIRGTGISIPYHFANGLFGGLIALISFMFPDRDLFLISVLFFVFLLIHFFFQFKYRKIS